MFFLSIFLLFNKILLFQVYVGLLHQLEAEDAVKQGSYEGVRSAQTKMKTNAFVVTLSGATDVYKR